MLDPTLLPIGHCVQGVCQTLLILLFLLLIFIVESWLYYNIRLFSLTTKFNLYVFDLN